MLMSVSEAILFIASNSRACLPTLSLIEHTGLPVEIVRLDTSQSRQIAMTGKYFQIRAVPTLVVVYSDGNLQLFVGAPKINQWLSMITQPSARPLIHPPEEYIDDNDIPEEPPRPPTRRTPVIEQMPEEEDSPEGHEMAAEENPSKKRVKPKKKKKPPVSFEEGEEPQDQGEAPQGKSRMSSIVDMAKQLEAERKNSLGYDESKLPRFH
jgi:hypothetical protein